LKKLPCTAILGDPSRAILPVNFKRKTVSIRYRLNIEDVIKEQIANNDVILFMKGTPQFPQCGFSAQVVDALKPIGRQFAYVNILENPDIRAALPAIANWPTFPQLWVKGELVGGCDIVVEMARNGELKPLLEQSTEQ